MIAGLLLLGYVTKTSAEFSRRVLLTWGVAGPVAMVILRLLMRFGLRALRARGRNQHRAAIAGAGPLGLRIADRIRSEPWMGLHLVGFFDDRSGVRDESPGSEPTEICGDLDELVKRARCGEIDVVYIALPMRDEERMRALVRNLATTPVSAYFVPDLLAFALLRSRWCTVGAIPTVSLFESPFSRFERAVKRAEDLALASCALALAALPMALIALCVRLESPGPVLFRQHRHGRDGREIVVWKFRTMTACESAAEFRQVRRGDPRVSRLGAILRATSFDELPQLLNVLQGTMSLVGPRPHPIPLNEQHRDTMDWYMLRHRVKPGMTGWAQVNGFRGETDVLHKMQGRVDRDLEYIHNWSLSLDLRILALTVVRGFVGKNAY
jgi:putative colanic acid biosynthesis UDP-glucose lipid carrier transferase